MCVYECMHAHVCASVRVHMCERVCCFVTVASVAPDKEGSRGCVPPRPFIKDPLDLQEWPARSTFSPMSWLLRHPGSRRLNLALRRRIKRCKKTPKRPFGPKAMRLPGAWQGTSCESRGGGGEQTGWALCVLTLDLEPSGSSSPACHGPPRGHARSHTPFSQRLHVSWCLLFVGISCAQQKAPVPSSGAGPRDTRQPLPCKSQREPRAEAGAPSARTRAASLHLPWQEGRAPGPRG